MLEQIMTIPAGVCALVAFILLFYRPTWGLIAIAVIYPINLWAPRLPVPGLNTETILVGVAMALTLLRYGVHLPPMRFSGPVLAFIGVILAAFLISLPWVREVRLEGGESPIFKVFQIFKSMVFTAFLFFPVYWWFGEEDDRRRLLRGISAAGAIAAIFGIIDFIVPINPKSGYGRAMGLMDDPNAMAQVLGVTIFPSLYLFFHARGISQLGRLLHAAAYGLSVIAIILSLSRGNWLAFAAAHFVYFLYVNRSLLAAGVAGLALTATIAFPLLPSIVQERIERTTNTQSRTMYRIPGGANLESSAAFRVVAYRVGAEMFMESPIWGHGLHYYTLNTPQYGAKYGLLLQKDAHSLPLKLAAETGLIGLGMLGVLVLTSMLHGRRLWRSDTPEYGMGAMVMGTTVYMIVANLSSTAFLYTKPIPAYFWIQLGVTARAYVEQSRARGD